MTNYLILLPLLKPSTICPPPNPFNHGGVYVSECYAPWCPTRSQLISQLIINALTFDTLIKFDTLNIFDHGVNWPFLFQTLFPHQTTSYVYYILGGRLQSNQVKGFRNITSTPEFTPSLPLKQSLVILFSLLFD